MSDGNLRRTLECTVKESDKIRQKNAYYQALCIFSEGNIQYLKGFILLITDINRFNRSHL